MTDLDVPLESLVAARTSVHGLAEQVFAAAARAATGSIRLYVRDGALSTPDLPRVAAPGRAEEPTRLTRRPRAAPRITSSTPTLARWS